MPDQEDAENYTSQARYQGHVASHMNGISTVPTNSGEKRNIDVEQDSGLQTAQH
jgi:hypothetical protein